MDFIDYIKQHSFNPVLNPFSKSFSIDFVNKTLTENNLNVDDFLSYALIGNEQYKNLYNYLESLKKQKQLPLYFILAITLINHNYMELSMMHTRILNMN